MTAGDILDTGIATVFAGIARARGERAIHPRGAVRAATLRRFGLTPPTGVRWLDEPGEEEVLVRLSRSAGLPPPWPDLFGLALRTEAAGAGPSDLLLTTAGRAPLLRHVLLPGRAPDRVHYTGVVPFRTPSGRLMVGASPEPNGFGLEVARPAGPWVRFARLELPPGTGDGDDEDRDVDLDAVAHPLPGLEMPPWLARLRGPAYRASRAARRRAGQGRGAVGSGT